MEIPITLKPEDDRVVILSVTDQYGEKYRIAIEFLNHWVQEDDVQVNIYKELEDGGCMTANQILFNDETVARVKRKEVKDTDGKVLFVDTTRIVGGVWYEFHQVDDIPAVRSKP